MKTNGDWRTQPMYSFRDVSRLSGVSVSTVKNWLVGYSTAQGEVEPLLRGHASNEKACSFLHLIEIVVAAKFRKAERESYQTVRRAYDNARKLYNLEYPFASMDLKAIGGHIVHIMRIPGISLQAIDQPEQYTIPDLVQEAIAQLDYEYDLAARWYPAGKEIPIVVDPRISAGLPVIQGRGITVETIKRRFQAKQKMEFIERDFELEHELVEEAIRFPEVVPV
ncbi:MAG TPA: DUF433 domain-containing protein [Dehalococcoidia bacterium]|nr:DUF433 domain-containing protein [Dehalococcoidia bacterium]